MAELNFEQKLKELEKQSQIDRQARIQKTIEILKGVAEKEMTGKEKEQFLEDMGEKPIEPKKNEDTTSISD